MMKKGQWIVESPEGMEGVLGKAETFSSLEDIFDVTRDESARKSCYEDHIKKELVRLTNGEGRNFGALVMEPLILGAGGMQFW